MKYCKRYVKSYNVKCRSPPIFVELSVTQDTVNKHIFYRRKTYGILASIPEYNPMYPLIIENISEYGIIYLQFQQGISYFLTCLLMIMYIKFTINISLTHIDTFINH